MVLHAKVPEVMRIAVKCAKIYLRKVDLRDIKLLRTFGQTEDTVDNVLPKVIVAVEHNCAGCTLTK
jgi:hypothetical protein